MNKVELLRCPVAGLKFHGAWDFQKPIYQSQICSLVREPSNKYDPRAIQVIAPDGNMLGYIPRGTTEEIHNNWDREPTATVILHQPKVIVIAVMVDEIKLPAIMSPDEIPQLGEATLDKDDLSEAGLPGDPSEYGDQ